MQLIAKTYDPQRAMTAHREVGASDLASARQMLESEGLVVLSIKARQNSFGGLVSLRRQFRQKFDVHLFCIELSTLLRAGLGLSEALESLSSRENDQTSEVFGELLRWLLEGQPFSEAMTRSVNYFPPILIAAVRANERTGKIADALDEFARFEEAVRNLRRKAVSAAVYPVVVVSFGVLVALFLLGYVIPRFSAIYDDTVIQMSTATRVVLWVGRTLDTYAVYLALVTLALGILIVHLLSSQQRRRNLLAKILSTGLIAPFARKFQIQRICQSLTLLLRGGYALPQALRLAGASALQPALAEALVHTTRLVEEGRAVSAAWSEAGLGDEFARRILQAGERTGELAIGFETLATTYARQIDTSMDRASRLIEPVILMLVASLIGAIVVLMYMPIFDLAGGIQ